MIQVETVQIIFKGKYKSTIYSTDYQEGNDRICRKYITDINVDSLTDTKEVLFYGKNGYTTTMIGSFTTKYKSIKKFVNGLILMHLLLIFIGFILGLIAFQGTGYTFVGIPDGILFDTYPRCDELNFLCRILNGIFYALTVFTFPLKLAIKFFAFIL